MMKYEDVVTIENGLKAMLEDEEKGIAEYERLAREARSLGATNTAMALQGIMGQEKKHAQILRQLLRSTEIAKVAYAKEQEPGAVSEPRRGGYAGEGAYARPPLKELSKVPETKVLPPPRIRGREPYAVRIPLKEMVKVPETKVLPPPRLRVGEGYRGYAGTVKEPRRAGY